MAQQLLINRYHTSPGSVGAAPEAAAALKAAPANGVAASSNGTTAAAAQDGATKSRFALGAPAPQLATLNDFLTTKERHASDGRRTRAITFQRRSCAGHGRRRRAARGGGGGRPHAPAPRAASRPPRAPRPPAATPSVEPESVKPARELLEQFLDRMGIDGAKVAYYARTEGEYLEIDGPDLAD